MQTWQAGKRTAVPMGGRDLIMYVAVLDIDNNPLLGQVSPYVSSRGPQNPSSIGHTRDFVGK
jgi:hypothetical protein